MDLSVSVVIPACNAGGHLAACLERVARLRPAPLECVVVDDGSRDDSPAIARQAGVKVLSTGGRRGPAVARNLGARAARGEILLFLDADVLVQQGAVRRIQGAFAQDTGLDAVIGSYDDAPGSPGLASQFRNLLHYHVHQSSRSEATSFWTGCGAVRRAAFESHGGFRETYSKPYLEDIEFGWRLRRGGGRIRLDKQLRVKHLKHWGLWRMLKTDLVDRAVPWTHLVLQYRSMPVDLNLRWEHRVSVALVCLLAGGAALECLRAVATGGPTSGSLWAVAAAATAAGLVWLNRGFYWFLVQRKGPWFALRALPLHALHFLTCGLGFGLGLLLYPFHRRALRARYSESSVSSK